MYTKKMISGDTMEILLSGKFDAVSAPAFDQEMEGQLAGITKVIMDLGDVEYISSAGLRSILSVQTVLDEVQGQVVVRNVPEIVQKIFDVTGFSSLVTIE